MKTITQKDKEAARLKELVREKYGRIAQDAPAPGTTLAKPAAPSCCRAPKAGPCCAPAPEPSAATYYGEDVAGIKVQRPLLIGDVIVEPNGKAHELHLLAAAGP